MRLYCIYLDDFLQLYNEENIRGVVTLNEDWELEDFSNSEEVINGNSWGIHYQNKYLCI